MSKPTKPSKPKKPEAKTEDIKEQIAKAEAVVRDLDKKVEKIKSRFEQIKTLQEDNYAIKGRFKRLELGLFAMLTHSTRIKTRENANRWLEVVRYELEAFLETQQKDP